MTTGRSSAVRVGLIGAGRIGTHHGTALARHVPRAQLTAVADAVATDAQALGDELAVPAEGRRVSIEEIRADAS